MAKHNLSRRSFVVVSAALGAAALVPQLALADDLGLVEPGKLTIGSDCDYPPFVYLEGSEPKGYEVELLDAICAKMGLELNFLAPQKFDTLLASVAIGGKMDLAVSSITITDERLEEVDFCTPYFDSNQGVYVLTANGYTDESDLDGKVIGAQSGTTGELWAKENLDGATITPFDDASTAFVALQAGKVDAVALDLPVGIEMIKDGFEDCEVLLEIPTGEQYGMAVSKDNNALRDAVDAAMAELEDEGFLDALYDKYFGLGDADDEELPEFTTLVEGVLTVGSDCDYPPFTKLDDQGHAAGFEYELLCAICDEIGLTCEYHSPLKFDTLVPAVAAGGTIDIAVSAMTISAEREDEIDFSDSYFDSNQSMTVLADSGYTCADDLEGKTIAVQSGTTGELWAKENIVSATVVPFDEAPAAFAALQAGKADAAIIDLPVAVDFLANGYDNCVIIEEIPTGEQYGFACSKDNPGLTEALNAGLAAVKEDGTYDAIYQKYFGVE